MSKGRLEAFSDGVMAILITIMVLELRPPETPHGEPATWDSLRPLVPVFIAYALSFANVGIYWNNHHHLLQAARTINGRVLWVNLFLLFWLSLFPFATNWIGESEFQAVPMALYGVIALIAGAAYSHLVRELRRIPGQPEALMAASGVDRKGILSLLGYTAGILISLLGFPLIAFAIYVAVAILWFVPDRRIEQTLGR